jgi:hypothetical protein
MALSVRNQRMVPGWAAKLLNVYLKTSAYVGDLGRPGLRDVIHPPIDAGLWEGFAKEFRGRPDILADACCVQRIRDISDYATYRRVIAGCRTAAQVLGCSLIEVEQLWLGSSTPSV